MNIRSILNRTRNNNDIHIYALDNGVFNANASEATTKLQKIEEISRLDYELKHRYRELEELKQYRSKYESYGELERVIKLDEEIKKVDESIKQLLEENEKKDIKLNKIQEIILKLLRIKLN